MHIQRRNQQVNRRLIKVTNLLMAPEPAWGLQTYNHASTSPLSFYRPDALPAPNQQRQSPEGK